jgi:hypothetical protein
LGLIAESARKTERLDARVLAEFLALAMIPEAHRPTPRQRQHRAPIRHCQPLQGRVTSARTKIHQLLADSNADRKGLFAAGRGPAYFKVCPQRR